jgi:hypothetical protein
MTPEQVTLLAQLLTLGGIAISIAWGTLQHRWSEQSRVQIEATREAEQKAISDERKADAAKLEQDRVLLAAELDGRRLATAAAAESALEARATEIRDALDAQAREIRQRQEQVSARLDEISRDIGGNTTLTQEAVDRATEALHESNNANAKIAHVTALTQKAVDQAGRAYREASGALSAANSTNEKILRIAETTDARVRAVEDAVKPTVPAD